MIAFSDFLQKRSASQFSKRKVYFDTTLTTYRSIINFLHFTSETDTKFVFAIETQSHELEI